ncbi:MAG: hypothetical protein ACP5XB_22325 [Isosphaeraceae bacterium]
MQHLVLAMVLAGTLSVTWVGNQDLARAAAPAPTSYVGVEKAIASIREGWTKPGGAENPNAPGWNALCSSLEADLKEYSQATSPANRLTPLNRVYQVSTALASVPWPPAMQLREELRQWLRPRVRLAWAERRLDDTIRGLPRTDDPAVQANRHRWVEFVENDLGKALGQYNSATTVSQRQEALKQVHEALASLRTRNAQRPWQPSNDLQTAVNDLFNRPNLDITADISVVQPVFEQNLVTTGPVYRKGYWSQVTAGPKTGFGLLASDNGIAFYNSQLLTSVTPITDFNNQVASDPQGQRATKLYTFSATSYDWSQLTVYTILTTTGLVITPASSHNINAVICSAPTAGGGFGRLVAGLIGMNQSRINQKVYDGAIANFRQRIPQEAKEEAEERIAGEQATHNAQLQQYLIGNDMVKFAEFLVTGLTLRSRPEAVYVGGLLQSQAGDRQRGADAPQPSSLEVPNPGVTADVHLISVLNSVADGLYHRPEVQSVDNLMLVTKDVPPGSPPKDAVKISKNVDFPTYIKAVDEARKANNPKVTALRVKRPPHAPEFAVDAQGRLVALLTDIELEVPAPDRSSQAGAMIGIRAKVLRLKIPQLEVSLSYTVDSADPGTHQIKAHIEEFMPAPTSSVLAIENDPAQGKTLTRFSGALVISALGAKLRSQPLSANIAKLDMHGFAVQSVSQLDPSGWVRVTLALTGTPTPKVPTAPATHGPPTSSPAASASPAASTSAVPAASSPVAAAR